MKIHRRFITFSRILKTGVYNFFRNLSLGIAAIAVMFVTLTIILFSLITNATFSHTITTQVTSKIDVSVFLKDSVTPAQTTQLLEQLKALPNVKSIQYLDKDQVLKQYEQENATDKQLSTAIAYTSNPLPATILIKPVDLNQLSSIKNFLIEPTISNLQSSPPSYSGSQETAINRITHATDVLREVGIVSIIVFAIICALIIFNTIQMAIFNRREEIQVMRLLGASTHFIRGPFIVESSMYGVFAAIISVAVIYAVFITTKNTLQASALGILDINYASTYFHKNLIRLLALQLLIGIVLGAVSSQIATHRFLKFKTK
jgi:cell division transport system permease protein